MSSKWTSSRWHREVLRKEQQAESLPRTHNRSALTCLCPLHPPSTSIANSKGKSCSRNLRNIHTRWDSYDRGEEFSVDTLRAAYFVESAVPTGPSVNATRRLRSDS